MSKIRRALALSFLQNYATTLIQFVASLIVARLLTPAEFGTFSVAMVLVAVAQVLRDFGVADYIAQERDLTVDKIRTASALAMVTGFGLAAVLLLVAWPASIFYREAGVAKVMSVLAISFMLIPFGTVTMAWVRRNLDFGKILVVRLASAIVGSSTTVMLAFAGFSYMSMAWGLLAGSIVTILLALRYRPRDWPWRPSLRHMREVFRFGAWSSGTAIVIEVARGVPDLIIGRVISLVAVGFYGRANTILDIVYRVFTSAVYTVAAPYFAEKNRAGGDLRQGFCNTVRYLTALVWPALAAVGILAPELIALLYGSQWLPSVDLVRIIVLGNMLYVPYLLWSTFYTGLGRLRPAFNVLLFTLICRVAVLIVAAPFGLIAVTIAMSAMSLVSVAASQVSLSRVFGISLGAILRAAGPSLAIAVPSIAITLLATVLSRGQHLPGWAVIVIAAATTLPVWLAMVFAVRHPIAHDVRRILTRWG
ncbi:MAG: lipopolysaccharide biosynthesis protein [Aromatoleum sp.]|nr:lipopolysaccharide biosynthesis protein [Aromatoleum sp.]